MTRKQLMRLNQRELCEFVEAVRSGVSRASSQRRAPRVLLTLEQALERERVRRIAAIFEAA
jgi:hypothetical protein